MAGLSSALAGHRRRTAAVLAAIGVAGLAAGLAVAAGTGAGTRAAGKAAVLSSGAFRSISWPTKGSAAIVRRENGSLVLRLSDGFQTKEAPELYVYTAKPGENRVEVAELRASSGDQQYSLPADVARNPRLQVIIWCGECNKAWGAAWLRPSKLA